MFRLFTLPCVVTYPYVPLAIDVVVTPIAIEFSCVAASARSILGKLPTAPMIRTALPSVIVTPVSLNTRITVS